MTQAPGGHGHSASGACSVLWDQAHAPAPGTAAQARFWVALEQPGPWGREAATQSHLDPDVGAGLARLCAEHGGRLLLIRRPGAHADRRGSQGQRVYVAGGLTDRPWLLEADLDLPSQLGRLPWPALAAGDIDIVLDAVPELDEARNPVLLVCTNSRRDVCCAVRGRPVALAAAQAHPGRGWELSHTRGPPVAPTRGELPWGPTLARREGDLPIYVFDAAD
ncbi:MAG: sucrase ferredoxin, partial [Oryzihumus sp.]